MPCYHPIPGWYAKRRNESGKRSIVFEFQEAYKDRQISVPCGRCIGCRLEKSRQWATRCMHEASLYERNCFVTLTYNDENLPVNGLVPEHFVLFMKRLRKRYGDGIRFFHCGEYGEKLGRPHHHTLLFNHDFDDKRVFHGGRSEHKLYESAELSRLWPYGFCSIGECNFESAGYVARYALKKVTGPEAELWYKGAHPEYLTMSRRPGIGRKWIDKYRSDVYPSDELVVNGAVTKPPRYYDEVVEKSYPSMLEKIKRRRRVRGGNDEDSTGKRLLVREVVKEAAVNFLKRDLEFYHGP